MTNPAEDRKTYFPLPTWRRLGGGFVGLAPVGASDIEKLRRCVAAPDGPPRPLFSEPKEGMPRDWDTGPGRGPGASGERFIHWYDGRYLVRIQNVQYGQFVALSDAIITRNAVLAALEQQEAA